MQNRYSSKLLKPNFWDVEWWANLYLFFVKKTWVWWVKLDIQAKILWGFKKSIFPKDAILREYYSFHKKMDDFAERFFCIDLINSQDFNFVPWNRVNGGEFITPKLTPSLNSF